MSISSKKRKRTACIHAYRLRQSGWTNREIATAMGVKVDAVPGMIKIGERFADEGDVA